MLFVLIVVLALVCALLIFLLVDVPLLAVAREGARKEARVRARGSLLFRCTEPVLRILGRHASSLSLREQRERVDKALVAAGELGGLCADEIFGLSLLSALAALGLALYALGGSPVLFALCCFAGPFLPWFHLRSLAAQRHRSIDRGLPAAIDLAALCMGAGSDFPGAVKHVVANMPLSRSPVRAELERLLHELSLGRTRKQSLESFAERVQTDAVREFVAAVVQAEAKGTPLSEVLAVQAQALRARRSVMAEEAAARAGVMLMLPMLMMVVSIVLLLMGPLFIQMSAGGIL